MTSISFSRQVRNTLFHLKIIIMSVIFVGIIPSKFIANVVPDGRFSASSIDENTQIVKMDEWTADSLSCEDAKRILQGKLHD